MYAERLLDHFMQQVYQPNHVPFRTHFLPVPKMTPAVLTQASQSLDGSGKRCIKAFRWPVSVTV